MPQLLARPFFTEFTDTSLVLERADKLVAFLIGFLSQSQPADAYIHAVGVAPAERGCGLASQMYQHFFAIVREHGRTTVRAVTSRQNTASISFHRRLGFDVIEPSGRDGQPVRFRLELESEVRRPVETDHARSNGERLRRRHPERPVSDRLVIKAIVDEAFDLRFGGPEPRRILAAPQFRRPSEEAR